MKITIYILIFMLLYVCVSGFFFRNNRRQSKFKLKTPRISIGRKRTSVHSRNRPNLVHAAAKNVADAVRRGISRLGLGVSLNNRRKNTGNRNNRRRKIGLVPKKRIDPIRKPSKPRDTYLERRHRDYSRGSRVNTDPILDLDPIITEAHIHEPVPVKKSLVAKPFIGVAHVDKRPSDYGRSPIDVPIGPVSGVDIIRDPVLVQKNPQDYGRTRDLVPVVNPVLTEASPVLDLDPGYVPKTIPAPIIPDKNPKDYGRKESVPFIDPFPSEHQAGYVPDSNSLPIIPDKNPKDYGRKESVPFIDPFPSEQQSEYVPDVSPVLLNKNPQDYGRKGNSEAIVDPILLQQDPGYVPDVSPVILNKNPQDYGRKGNSEAIVDPILLQQDPGYVPDVSPVILNKNPQDYGRKGNSEAIVDPILLQQDPGYVPDVSPVILNKNPQDYGRIGNSEAIVDPILLQQDLGYVPDVSPVILNKNPQDYGRKGNSEAIVDPILLQQDPGYIPDVSPVSGIQSKNPQDYGRDVIPVSDPIVPDVVRPFDHAFPADPSMIEPVLVEKNLQDYGRTQNAIPISDPIPEAVDPFDHASQVDPSSHFESIAVDPSHVTTANDPGVFPEVLEVIEDPSTTGLERRIFQGDNEKVSGVGCQWGGCKDGFHCVKIGKGRILKHCTRGSPEICKCIEGCKTATGIMKRGKVRGCPGCKCRNGSINCRGENSCHIQIIPDFVR